MRGFLQRHPVGFFFLFWGELAERASFYGMQTLLVFYLVDVYRYSEAASGAVVEYFTAACYVLPLLGSWLADRWLGRYRTIVTFSVPYVAGHVILGERVGAAWLALALGLLALGAGAVKPNTSTLMGLLYEREGKQEHLAEAFAWYYSAINVGGGAAAILLPMVREHYGYRTALLVPAVMMALALVLFASGRRFYPAESPGGAAAPPLDWTRLRRLGGMFGLIALFWFVHDQMSTTWLLTARDHMNLHLLPLDTSLVVSPGQLNGINPILIVLVTPLFHRVWPRSWDAPARMEVGFWLSLACMVLLAGSSLLARPTVWWMIAAIVLITLAELCVNVVGLQFAYEQAPPQAKSRVMALFLLTVFAGDSLAGLAVGQYYGHLPEWQFFGAQALLMAAVLPAFRRAARRFRAAS